MSYQGSWKIVNGLLTFVVNTHSPSTGAQTDADSPPTYRIYEDETGTPVLAGTMAKLDDANTTGFYSEQIDLDASAPGFETGKSYNIRIEAAVGGVTGAAVLSFQAQADVNIVSVTDTDVVDVDDFKADVSGLGSVNIIPVTATVNRIFQINQQVDVVVGNKGALYSLSLDGDWTAYNFRHSVKDEPDSSAFSVGPNDVAAGDVNLSTDADGNTITVITIRFGEGDLDIDAAVYTAELTADTGDSSGADLITTIQYPFKVIEGLIG